MSINVFFIILSVQSCANLTVTRKYSNIHFVNYITLSFVKDLKKLKLLFWVLFYGQRFIFNMISWFITFCALTCFFKKTNSSDDLKVILAISLSSCMMNRFFWFWNLRVGWIWKTISHLWARVEALFPWIYIKHKHSKKNESCLTWKFCWFIPITFFPTRSDRRYW